MVDSLATPFAIPTGSRVGRIGLSGKTLADADCSELAGSLFRRTAKMEQRRSCLLPLKTPAMDERHRHMPKSVHNRQGETTWHLKLQ
jgi:hypothetical protein